MCHAWYSAFFPPPHINRSPSVGQIMHAYAARLREAKQYERALRMIQFVIEIIRPSPEHLTPFHADYLMICLKAKNFRLASNLVDQKILDIQPELTGLTPTDMLLYYFYGGNVYVGLKQFVKAERFYDTGLTVPAFAQSAIMVEIFKRFVLVQLLNHGNFLGINKSASNIVHKHMKSFCSSYIDFANAFTDGDAEVLKNVAKEKKKEFAEDKNMGIINQCIEALSRRNIQKLTATYLTLSLDAVAKHINLAGAREAELILLRMIDHGEIAARINHKDGMVVFQEEQDNLNITDRVNYQINQCITLAQKLKNMDDTLASSHAYLARKNGLRDDVFGPKNEGKSKFGRVLDMFAK